MKVPKLIRPLVRLWQRLAHRHEWETVETGKLCQYRVNSWTFLHWAFGGLSLDDDEEIISVLIAPCEHQWCWCGKERAIKIVNGKIVKVDLRAFKAAKARMGLQPHDS